MGHHIITNKEKDPLGTMLLDYLRGHHGVYLDVDSPGLEMTVMTGEEMFRDYPEMNPLERYALDMCHGKVLDVGAGSGRHSLFLQRKGLEVDAIDISPGCVEVMQQRGVCSVKHRHLFALEETRYNTILMLMNGLGICGTLDGFHLFLQYVTPFLEKGGVILGDSTDITSLSADEEPGGPDSYCGETEFVMHYKGIASSPFAWVYLDFGTLSWLCEHNEFVCRRILNGVDGHYLAAISKN